MGCTIQGGLIFPHPKFDGAMRLTFQPRWNGILNCSLNSHLLVRIYQEKKSKASLPRSMGTDCDSSFSGWKWTSDPVIV